MWFLPTMGRAARCQEVMDAALAAGISTPGMILVNGPQEAEWYQALTLPPRWSMDLLPENLGICGALNLAFHQFPNEPWYGLVCDDEFVFTQGFNLKLVAATERIGIAHGNDGWRSEKRIHTYVVFGGDLLRQTGWWALPGLWHWYFDDVWETIAQEFGLRRFCRDVQTEHRHYATGRAPNDATYQSGESRSEQDKERFRHWKESEWPQLRRSLAIHLRPKDIEQ